MTFMGYRRPDGSVGVRNHVVALPTANCVDDAVFEMCARVPGTIPLCHNLACTHFIGDKEKARRAMVGILKNPNVYAALIVGIGNCDPYMPAELAAAVASTGKPVFTLEFKDYEDTDELLERGTKFLRDRFAEAEVMEREPCDVGSLTIASKCAGSGTLSVLSNNAVVGKASDILVSYGGKAIFSETAELLGVDKIVAARAVAPEIGKKLVSFVDRLKDEIARSGVDIIGSEPAPGNIVRGLSTIEEKALGSIAKSGTTPIVGALEYAEPADNGPGVYFMDADAVGQAVYSGAMAAGAQIAIFSNTGGIPARMRTLEAGVTGMPGLPIIKILGSNDDPRTAKYFDIYVGEIIDGTMSIDEGGEKMFETILRIASGEKTYAETNFRYYTPVDFYRNGLLL